jgi:hypothetical protein
VGPSFETIHIASIQIAVPNKQNARGHKPHCMCCSLKALCRALAVCSNPFKLVVHLNNISSLTENTLLSITKTNQLMLFMDEISVYWESCSVNKHTTWTKCRAPDAEAGGKHSNHCAEGKVQSELNGSRLWMSDVYFPPRHAIWRVGMTSDLPAAPPIPLFPVTSTLPFYFCSVFSDILVIELGDWLPCILRSSDSGVFHLSWPRNTA